MMQNPVPTGYLPSNELLTCALQNLTGNLTKVRKKLTGYDIRYDIRYGIRYGFQGRLQLWHSHAENGLRAGSDTIRRLLPLWSGMTGWYEAGECVRPGVKGNSGGVRGEARFHGAVGAAPSPYGKAHARPGARRCTARR